MPTPPPTASPSDGHDGAAEGSLDTAKTTIPLVDFNCGCDQRAPAHPLDHTIRSIVSPREQPGNGRLAHVTARGAPGLDA